VTWRDRAACKDMETDLFFAEQGENHKVKAAKAVCAGCPVVHDCLHEALKISDLPGVWGGLSFSQRRSLRAGMSYVVVACVLCGDQFPVPPRTGQAAKFCEGCKQRRNRESNRRARQNWRERQVAS
jgi:WhiB family redox-sensing transcriptional regulator